MNLKKLKANFANDQLLGISSAESEAREKVALALA